MKSELHARLRALKAKSKPSPKLTPPKTTAEPSLAPEVLAASEQGFKLFPVKAHGKTPLVKNWQGLATSDIRQLEAWANQFPDCNWGLATGTASGVAVIDIDGFEGRMAVAAWEATGLRLPKTRTHETGKGKHLLFRSSHGVRNSAGKLAPGLDVRGDGGYIVVPPSIHENGTQYKVIVNTPPAELPGWLRKKMLTTPGAKVAADVIPQGQRDTVLTSAAGTLRHAGKSQEEIEAALSKINQERCKPPKDEEDVLRIAKSVARYALPDDATALLNDPRPKILLAGDGRDLATFATEVGEVLADKPVFVRAREVVILEGRTLLTVSAQTLRTLVTKYLVCIKKRVNKENHAMFEVVTTMVVGDALGTLASPQFKEQLRPLERVGFCRLPVMRADGHIELLPEGYDDETQTLTISDVAYAQDMPITEGVAIIEDVLSEFSFTDRGRSKAVTISGLLGLYAAQIMPVGTKRPVFITAKNCEGAGGSLLTACMVVPVIGDFPATDLPTKEEEVSKTLLTHLRKADSAIVFDNVKTIIGGAALEGFTDNVRWGGRLLGVNEDFEGPNNSTVFFSGNGCTVTPDMRRRSLFVELHLDEEHAEDHKYKRVLNVAVLKAMRPKILAACWSLVRHWDELGRPLPSQTHSNFPEWSSTIAGIVEASGFDCPLATPETVFALDEDGDAMRLLAAAMKREQRYSATELYALCRANQIFTGLVGLHEGAMDKAQFTTMGRLLARYHNRLVGKSRFLINGTGHGRRFLVKSSSTDQHDRMIEHDPAPYVTKHTVFTPRVKHHADHADHANASLPKFTRAGHVQRSIQ